MYNVLEGKRLQCVARLYQVDPDSSVFTSFTIKKILHLKTGRRYS